MREKKEKLKEAVDRAEKLKKEAAGDISTVEELQEVKRKMKDTEEEIEAIEQAEKRMKEETWISE